MNPFAINVLSESPEARALAEAVNPETIREMGEEIRQLRTEVFHLQRRERRHVSQAALTAAIVEWFLDQQSFLVVDLDGEKPIRLDTLLELAVEGDSGAQHLFARAISAAAHAQEFPRPLCYCSRVECHGCGRDAESTVVPVAVRNLIGEVRR